MIKVRLYGGLGNQIFQLGMAVYISKMLNRRIMICDYTNRYKTTRLNELGVFFDLDKLDASLYERYDFIHKTRLARLIDHNSSRLTTINDRNVEDYLDRGFSSVKGKVVYLDGYFQLSYNQHVFERVLSLLADSVLMKKPKFSPEFCVIHIRGGDFLTSKSHFSLDKGYYERGLQCLSNYVKRFVVVTDDIIYADSLVKTIELPSSVELEIYEGVSAASDFELIMNSKYAILSNSTFSIWAGALRQKKAIFAPDDLSVDIKRNFRYKNEILWSKK